MTSDCSRFGLTPRQSARLEGLVPGFRSLVRPHVNALRVVDDGSVEARHDDFPLQAAGLHGTGKVHSFWRPARKDLRLCRDGNSIVLQTLIRTLLTELWACPGPSSAGLPGIAAAESAAVETVVDGVDVVALVEQVVAVDVAAVAAAADAAETAVAAGTDVDRSGGIAPGVARRKRRRTRSAAFSSLPETA